MKTLPIDKHALFFEKQLLAMEEEWRVYNKAKVLHLWENGGLFIGRLWGYDEVRGNYILRFKKGNLPRLRMPYQLCLVSELAGSDVYRWDFSYEDFRGNYTRASSRAVPIYHMKPEGDWRYVGVSGVSLEFSDVVRQDMNEGNHPLIVLAQEDPPFRYLLNLKNFVAKQTNNEVLLYGYVKPLDAWQPKPLPAHDKLLEFTLGLLEDEDTILIQGPPGTGKTHLVANICKHFADADKAVCVTALTNRSLMEVAGGEALEPVRARGGVQKTNLSSDEVKRLPGIKNAGAILAMSGTVTLSTYYLLSDHLAGTQGAVTQFDLMVIEEASQAYLATLAGFIGLGTKVLIVGDPMQMFPIVLKEKECLQIHDNITNAIQGLEVYSVNNEPISYRITQSYRLTHKAAEQTGVFYNNQLSSVSPLNGSTLLQSGWTNLFCPEGGTTLLKLGLLEMERGKGFQLATDIVRDLRHRNPGLTIALLSNLKVTVARLFDAFLSESSDFSNLEIETIDRIQGLTADVTILLFESNLHFGLQRNRFNVATSRAKRGTLIITSESISMQKGINAMVLDFLESAKPVNL